MNGSPELPSIDTLKTQATQLRASLDAEGTLIGHGKALELLARRYGYKDWNTLRTAAGNGPPPCPVTLGERVRGSYLGQAFAGEVIGVKALSHTDRFRVTVTFDEPVDVVRFDSFSNLRQRVSCTIDSDGRTPENTSDGRPQLVFRS